MAPLTLGPFVLQREILFILLSILAGYTALKFRMGQTNNNGLGIDSLFTNSVLLGFLIWKFSFILFDPIGVINQPAQILYFDGGSQGMWLAITVVLIYLLYQRRKNVTSWAVFMDAAAVSWLGAYGAYHLLLLTSITYDWVNHLMASIWSVIWLGVLLSNKIVNLLTLLRSFQWYFIGQVFIQFLSHSSDVIWGFHMEQAVYLVSATATIICSVILEKKIKNKGGLNWRM